MLSDGYCFSLNPFNLSHTTGVFLYPLKTSRKQRFSDDSRGYGKR